MAGQDLAKVVSVDKPYDWNGSLWALGTGYQADGAARTSTSSPSTTA